MRAGRPVNCTAARAAADPVGDRLALEVLEDDLVDLVDVLRVAGDREPAERADALAEERTDVALREHAHLEGVLDAQQLGARPQAVAVLEDLRPAPLELEHRADVVDQRGVGAADQLLAVARAQLVALGRGHAARHVAADRIDRRLVGDDVGRDAALEQGVQHVGDVGDEPDRDRLAPLLGAEHERERALEVVAAVLQVALAQAPLDPLGIDLDDERRRARQHAGQRLRAAHAAEAGGQHEPALQRAAEVLAPGGHERLVGALQDPLRADVLPGAGGHAGEHREARVDQLLPAPAMVAQRPTTLPFAITAIGESRCVRKRPIGLPDCTTSV